MSTTTRVLSVFTLAAAVLLPLCGRAVFPGPGASAAQESKGANTNATQEDILSKFMRAKLNHSKDVLEGLSTADFEKIAEGAHALRALTENEQWRVSPDMAYVRFTTEFQRLAGELEENARKQNLDGATLNYVNLTINCVNCHKFVRDNRITQIDESIRLR